MATDVRSESPASSPSHVNAPSTSRPSANGDPPANRRRWKRVFLVILAVSVLGAVAVYRSGSALQTTSNPKLTHSVLRRNLDVTVTEQGTLESSNNTEVRCKVKGPSSTVVWIIDNGTVVNPGDELVRIDTSTIETNINTQKIAYQNALATFAQSQSDVAVAEINITEYLEGTYRAELKTKEKDVAIAQANLRSAQNILNHAQEMYRKGFISKLELEGNEYSLQQAKLELEVKETEVDVLKRYTKAKQVQDLNGILLAKKAKLESDKAALDLEKAKLVREEQQLDNSIIRAESGGMVIYAEGERWEDKPDIREGATVREDQVLLLIPDLNNMQVKVGVHEAQIDRVKPGLRARIELQGNTYDGVVESVAPMAERGGWWNGNMVKYETTIKLDTQASIKPGMSADVKIFIAQHVDVVCIPVAAVVEQEGNFYCWVVTDSGTQRRTLDLGDSDDQFLVVEAGVAEGDEVVVNPIAFIEEAQDDALSAFSGVKTDKPDEGLDKPEQAGVRGTSKGDPKSVKQDPKPQVTGSQILKLADKNQDGVLTRDEFSEEDRDDFDSTDLNSDGNVDASELDAAIEKATDSKDND